MAPPEVFQLSDNTSEDEDEERTDDLLKIAMQVDTSIHLDLLMGKFSPETHEDFIEVPEAYANRGGHYLAPPSWRFIAVDALEEELEREPERFTPWFKLEWAHIKDRYLDEILRRC